MMTTLLQRGFNPPPQNPANNAAALGVGLGVLACIIFVAVVIAYTPLVFMLVRSMKALQAVSPRNRAMSPGLVWLSLIPCFNVIWNFLVVTKVSASLEEEFADRRLRGGGDHGKHIGLTYCVLLIVNIALSSVSQGIQAAMAGPGNGPAQGGVAFALIGLSCFSLILAIVQFILPFIYGAKLGTSTAILNRDEYDDRPRKKKRRPAREEYDDEPDERDDDFEEFDDDDNDRPRRLR